jgi:hypothetical protein
MFVVVTVAVTVVHFHGYCSVVIFDHVRVEKTLLHGVTKFIHVKQMAMAANVVATAQ